MAFNTYRATAPGPIYSSSADSNGVSWAGVSGGTGTIALAGGGYVTGYDGSTSGAASGPLPIPVLVKPSESDASYMLVGAVLPADSKMFVDGLWVTYWEAD